MKILRVVREEEHGRALIGLDVTADCPPVDRKAHASAPTATLPSIFPKNSREAPAPTRTLPVTVTLNRVQLALGGTTRLPLIVTPLSDPLQEVSARAAGTTASTIPNVASAAMAKRIYVLAPPRPRPEGGRQALHECPELHRCPNLVVKFGFICNFFSWLSRMTLGDRAENIAATSARRTDARQHYRQCRCASGGRQRTDQRAVTARHPPYRDDGYSPSESGAPCVRRGMERSGQGSRDK